MLDAGFATLCLPRAAHSGRGRANEDDLLWWLAHCRLRSYGTTIVTRRMVELRLHDITVKLRLSGRVRPMNELGQLMALFRYIDA